MKDVQVAANQQNNQRTMKLGKGTILAIFESLLFVIGAVFCALVLIIPSNPIWALGAGIACGLASAIMWSCSLFVRLGKRAHEHHQDKKITADNVAKKILADDISEDTYELHRADDYASVEDIIPDVRPAEPVSIDDFLPDTPAQSDQPNE